MAIMRNMLPFEKIAALDDDFSQLYCTPEFNGEFLRLYFAHKETELTI
jgi:hypothetical protein